MGSSKTTLTGSTSDKQKNIFLFCCNSNKFLVMAQNSADLFTIGLPENGRVPSKTTRIQPPGGVSHINSDMVPQSMDIRQANRVLKPPGGMSSNIFSESESNRYKVGILWAMGVS